MEYQIINTRSGGEYSIIGCDLALGYRTAEGEFVGQLIIRNVWLKQSASGKYFVSWPSAVRMRNGAPVKKEDGKLHYDNCMSLYGYDGAGNGDGWGVAESGWEFQETLVQDLLKEAGTKTKVESGRGGPASPGKGRPTTATKAVGGAKAGATATASRTPAVRGGTRPARNADPVEQVDGDDDLPF